jgi:hypothetical protein
MSHTPRMPDITLLTAFRGTGKDALVDDLTANRLSFRSCDEPGAKPRWIVWCNPKNQPMPPFPPVHATNIIRTPLAETLKQSVHVYLGLPEGSKDLWPVICAWRFLVWYAQWTLASKMLCWGIRLCWLRFVFGIKDSDFEVYKKDLLVPLTAQQAKQLNSAKRWISLRSVYISLGNSERAKDPNHWVKLVCNKINQVASQSTQCYLTDWRFPNEKEHITHSMSDRFSITTVRLFRADVIARPDEISEHDNDEQLTDFLLAPSCEDFECCVARFPQFVNFVPIWSIDRH